MTQRLLVALLGLVAAAAGAEPTSSGGAGRVDAARVGAADAEPHNWLVHGRTWNEQRFSPLASINTRNVRRLGLAWSYATGTRRGMEATPIVVDGVLYATGTWSVVYALDAATGREIWTFDPKVPRWKGRHACCDVVNRGVAVWKGRVYVGSIDGRLIALDAASGEPLWAVQTTDPAQPYTITGAPRVVKDLVVIGNGGADLGVRGYFSAYDAASGEMRWRFYTVPASREGPHEHPELAEAAATWSPDSMWESGLGGTVWDAMAYDPELDLLYVGVGNGSVYNREVRSPGGGDNLFLASILAVRPESGRLVWHYQTTPGESWDYTATQHMILADLEVDGRLRKVLLQAPKNGFFYVLDRASGELISAESYVEVSWATGVDLATGRPVERPEAHWFDGEAMVTPGPPGGHNWHPMTYSPRTGLVYIPSITTAYPYRPDPGFVFQPGDWNTAEDIAGLAKQWEGWQDAVRFCEPSHITAWDPVRQRRVWRIARENPMPAGLLSTAGDLLFQGGGNGVLSAYDARTSKRLWSSGKGVGIMAPPVTYAVDDEQYVAVLAGLGGSHGGHYTTFENGNDGRILAFKLGGSAPMPRVEPRRPVRMEAPAPDAAPETVARGRELYSRYCFSCHGNGVRSSGLHPDLRHSSREVHETWDAIVLGGTAQSQGMASFAHRLNAADAQAVHAYVIARAHHEPDLLMRLANWLGRYACIPVGWLTD
jgi:PQQ-dependent dehydrogenase (methanol/ethanol family)